MNEDWRRRFLDTLDDYILNMTPERRMKLLANDPIAKKAIALSHGARLELLCIARQLYIKNRTHTQEVEKELIEGGMMVRSTPMLVSPTAHGLSIAYCLVGLAREAERKSA